MSNHGQDTGRRVFAGGRPTNAGRRAALLALASLLGAASAAIARGGKSQSDDCPPDSADPDCKK
jgi:hypothetical protein